MQATIKVVMLKDDEGYPNGHTPVKYEKGKEYDLPESLALSFFQTKSADPAEAYKAAEAKGEVQNAPEGDETQPEATGEPKSAPKAKGGKK